jgi:hypothetical protein
MSVAMKRALIGGAITAGLTLTTTLGASAADEDISRIEVILSGLAAASTFFGYLLTRGLGEGNIDTGAIR